MACCKGTVSWECCYPDTCGCDTGCCQGTCCSCYCGSSSYIGQGSCCTCNSNQWGYAWPGCGSCQGSGNGLCPGCGGQLGFSNDCNLYRYPSRVDTGPASGTGHIADFTKALFTTWAPLSQGIITNMRATDNSGCC